MKKLTSAIPQNMMTSPVIPQDAKGLFGIHLNLILSTLLLTTSSLCLADTCPSIQEIKQHSLTGWQAYDSEDGKPLSRTRLDQFIKNIDAFSLAEWSNKHNNAGTIHCYYHDKNGSDLEAYLAKPHFSPNNLKQHWYEVSGSLHCAAGMDQCLFEKAMPDQPRLADNK